MSVSDPMASYCFLKLGSDRISLMVVLSLFTIAGGMPFGPTIPAQVTPGLLSRMQRVSARTFTAMDCEGLARVDLFVTPDDEVWVNELNTMPGFTYISMYPSLWAASGIAYPDLIAELIQLALDRPVGLR